MQPATKQTAAQQQTTAAMQEAARRTACNHKLRLTTQQA